MSTPIDSSAGSQEPKKQDFLVSDSQGRTAEQLLSDARERRSDDRLPEAVVLGYLALRVSAPDADAAAVIRARTHLFLSETMGAIGYRSFERIHAKTALAEQERITRSGQPLPAGPFLARLGEVTTQGGDYVLADHYLRLALEAYEAAEPRLPLQHAHAHVASGRLIVRRANLLTALDADRVAQLQAAHAHLDQALALVPDLAGNLDLANAIYVLQAELLTRMASQLPAGNEEVRDNVLAQAEQMLTDVSSDESMDSSLDDQLAALNGLMRIYRLKGDYVRSSELSGDAIAITEARQRGDIDMVLNMALTGERLNNTELVVTLCRLVMNLEESSARAVARISSEAQALAFSDTGRFRSMICLALLSRGAEENDTRARQLLDIVLRRKAIVTDAEGTFWNTLHRQSAADLQDARDRLIALRELLSSKTVRGDGEGLWNLVVAIESQEENLAVEPDYRAVQSAPERSDERKTVTGYAEALLAGKAPWDAIAEQEHELSDDTVDVESIQKSLPPDTVLVEFVKVSDFDLERELFMGSAHYWAVVVHANGLIQAVDLGSAQTLEDRVATSIRQLRTADPMEPEPQIQAMAELYDVLWSPLTEAVGNAHNVVLSVDGALGVVPFGALYDPDSKFLIERHRLRHATTGRSLNNKAVATPQTGQSLAVVDPDYDAADLANIRPDDQIARPVVGEHQLERLQATQREGEIFTSAMGGTAGVLHSGAATEGAVRAVNSPHVLHLATHGLFLGSDDSSPSDALSAADNVAFRTAYPVHVRTLSRSGLAFSGFNRGGLTGTDDAFLTAFDVASMNLAGTDLVVLSGCDTGLGDAVVGEGVLGLRRAFRIAGAHHVVMSLWRQKDKVAARQMRLFYEGYRKSGNPVWALHDMQLSQIRRYRRILQLEAPPALWAAWTIQGM